MADVYKFKNVHTLDLDKKLETYKWTRTQKEHMEITGFLAVVKPDDRCEKIIDAFVEDYKAGIIKEMPILIYSMWEGYIKPNNESKKQEWIDFIERQEAKGVEIKYLHTSGHATADMIQKVIIAVDPQEEIIPIHTECKAAFEKLNISEELRNRIRK